MDFIYIFILEQKIFEGLNTVHCSTQQALGVGSPSNVYPTEYRRKLRSWVQEVILGSRSSHCPPVSCSQLPPREDGRFGQVCGGLLHLLGRAPFHILGSTVPSCHSTEAWGRQVLA